ncbi:MAG: zinc ribbon domain-containing protein [Candidatus Peribacteria bacterium]|nr:zinc ribbon domain-containing protein [Candidatus Peribacteria bacterium]
MAKKKCPFCREEISENQKRCPFCGRILAEKVVIKKIEQQTEKSPIPKKEPIPEKSKKPKCPFCKAEIEKNTEFCPTCGRQIIENFSTPKTHKLSQQEILRKHITHIKSLLRTGQRNLAIQIMDTIMEDYILNDNE